MVVIVSRRIRNGPPHQFVGCAKDPCPLTETHGLHFHIQEIPRSWWFRLWLRVLRLFGLGDQ